MWSAQRRNDMELIVKEFADLTVDELYEILKVRCEVFVVEQECVYLDIDGTDRRSIHVFLKEDSRIIACLRIFSIGEDTVQIGRVLTAVRGKGFGRMILKEGIRAAKEHFHPKHIYLEAQTYAADFYAKEGFRVISQPFDEDGIPHVKMILDLQQ